MSLNMDQQNKKRILNLGCGNQTYGTHRIDLFKTESTTEVGDLNKKLPYPDNYFDEIYSNCVLEHIKNLDNFSRECFRVLKKGGKLHVHTDHAGYLLFYISKKHEHNSFLKTQYKGGFGYGHQEGDDAHYHLFVASHLVRLFKEFKNKRISYTYGGRNKIIRFFLKLIPLHLGAIGITIDAVK